MADKVRDLNQYHHLKAKYIGLGNGDTTREEFLTNVHRDTYSSLAQHDNILHYNAVGLNESPELLRQYMIKKMARTIKPANNIKR